MHSRIRHRNEAGAALLLLLLSLTTVVLLAGGLSMVGYLSLAKSELRSAADAAAYAGAVRLCSSRECYDAAYAATLFTLREQSARGVFGSSRTLSFDVDLTQPSPINVPDDISPTMTLNVEIGMHTEEGFTPFLRGPEGSIWTELHPGVPAYLAANAVRISLTRRVEIPLVSTFFPSTFTLSAQTTMRAHPLEEVSVAPFALPVCALIDSYGEMNFASLCAADRLFTSVDRYCPSTTDCDVDTPPPCCTFVPSFSWDPYEDGAVWSNTTDTRLTCGYSADTPYGCHYSTDPYCGWHSKRYVQRGDHFGVVGVPLGGGIDATESNIRVVVQTGGVTAKIGQGYAILPEGFTTKDAEQDIWTQINNAGAPGEGGMHPSYANTPLAALGASLDAGRIELSDLMQFNSYLPSSFPDGSGGFQACESFETETSACRRGVSCCMVGDTGCTGTIEAPPIAGGSTDGSMVSAAVAEYPSNGICHSKRFGPRPASESSTKSEGVGQLGEKSVWFSRIPIIADFSATASPCASVGPTFGDPYRIQTGDGHDWRIIGYVRSDFFDVDVGNDPPSLPTNAERLAMKTDSASATLADSFGGIVWPYGWFPTDTSAFPWGFPSSCNLVRARVRCDTDYIPDGGTDAGVMPRRPVVVEP